MPLNLLRKFAFIHHNTFTLFECILNILYISESFCVHVIFEYATASPVEKYVHRIQTQFVLNDTI
jgi:competence protein ComGF